MNNPNRAGAALSNQIKILGQSNVSVNAALHLFDCGGCTYEEALQIAVLQLAAATDAQQKTLIEFANRQPPPYIVRSAS